MSSKTPTIQELKEQLATKTQEIQSLQEALEKAEEIQYKATSQYREDLKNNAIDRKQGNYAALI